MEKEISSIEKILIIGGGVSGLYTAWRLLNENYKNVNLYEATPNVGGRLMTVMPSDLLNGKYTGELSGGTHCELGGMRLPSPESYDTYAIQLVEELQRELNKIIGDQTYSTKVKGEAKNFYDSLKQVDFPTDKPDNWHYLRGYVQQTKDLNNGEKYGKYENGYVPYGLSDEERKLINPKGNGMSGPMGYAIEGNNNSKQNRSLIEKNKLPDSSSRKDKLFEFVESTLTNSISIDGEKQELYKFGFSDVINVSGEFNSPEEGNLSNQYWKLFSEAGGYDTIPGSWNAATAASVIGLDFAGEPKYKTLKGGLRAIPATLEFLIKQKSPNCIKTKTAVTSIKYSSDNEAFDVITNDDTHTSEKSIILAIPPVAVEKLIGGYAGIYDEEELDTPLFSDKQREVRQRLAQVTPIPLLKVYLMYKITGNEAWWESVIGEIEQYTRMTTDLPLRQVYNFGTYCKDNDPNEKYAVLQISYDDDLNPGYWAGLLSKESGGIIDTGIFGDGYTSVGQRSYKEVMPLIKNNFGSDHKKFMKNHPLFAAAHEQFVKIVKQVGKSKGEQLKNIELPTAGACMDWGVAPYGGGVNFWNVGVDVSKEYWKSMRPNKDESTPRHSDKIFVVGEGYSIFQGWIEGALWTAEAVLEDYFSGLKKESWMPFDVSNKSLMNKEKKEFHKTNQRVY
ncbi:FAD-dependent oxidoreductase [Aquimarina aquimarini]|uniref:FAD-dependent oxidoreductase n=1 Tax=Aquimarina aquimarini TaxID=1191734 RepID=UPI000D54E0B9|nr:FAD-dependent oxidoreductase [Aquimarina aquimarini]